MNTQTQEALKMAIKEMTDAIPHLDVHFDDYFEAIQACKEALAQPAQEVGDAEIKQMLDDIEYYQKRVEELEQPAQEPYCWCFLDMFLDEEEAKEYEKDVDFSKSGAKAFPLYTHPAPSWQVLSDDEIDDISICEQISPDRLWHIYVAIEQALKEKNHG